MLILAVSQPVARSPRVNHDDHEDPWGRAPVSRQSLKPGPGSRLRRQVMWDGTTIEKAGSNSQKALSIVVPSHITSPAEPGY